MQKLNCWQFDVCTGVLMFLYSPCYDINRSCQHRRKGVLDAKASTVIWMDDDARWSQPFAPWQISLKYWSFHTKSMDVDWKATNNASEAWSSFIISMSNPRGCCDTICASADSLVISSVDQTPDHQSLEGIFIVEMERAQVHQLPSYLRLVS